MMKFKWWLLFILLFVVIVFTIQNYAPVTLKFLFWTASTSQAILVFIALFIGVLVGLLLRKKNYIPR